MLLRLASLAATLVKSILRLTRVVFDINVVREAARAHSTALRIMWRTSLLFGVCLALVACGPAASPAQTVTRPKETGPNETINIIEKQSNEVQPPATAAAPTTARPPTTAAPPSTTTEPPVNLQFPSAVLFGRTCGGTIISPTWVLSAGHCTLFTQGRDVLAGTANSEDDSGLRVRVKRLVIHPRFSVGPYWLDADKFDIEQVGARFDFLLVELKTPLPLDGITMAKAVLPELHEPVPPGLEVGYAGYGAEHHGETMRHHMHGMKLMTEADQTCGVKLEQYDPQDMICTVGRLPRNDSACNGDSGSGLMHRNKLLGVASWVQGDAKTCFRGALVVFSRVAEVRDWIQKVAKI